MLARIIIQQMAGILIMEIVCFQVLLTLYLLQKIEIK